MTAAGGCRYISRRVGQQRLCSRATITQSPSGAICSTRLTRRTQRFWAFMGFLTRLSGWRNTRRCSTTRDPSRTRSFCRRGASAGARNLRHRSARCAYSCLWHFCWRGARNRFGASTPRRLRRDPLGLARRRLSNSTVYYRSNSAGLPSSGDPRALLFAQRSAMGERAQERGEVVLVQRDADHGPALWRDEFPRMVNWAFA
jgi:hypothetical protein